MTQSDGLSAVATATLVLAVLVAVARGDEEQAHCSDAARRLAELINAGVPVDTRDHLSAQELEGALGVLVEAGSSGWSRRVGSFLELLREAPPRTIAEDGTEAANGGRRHFLLPRSASCLAHTKPMFNRHHRPRHNAPRRR